MRSYITHKLSKFATWASTPTVSTKGEVWSIRSIYVIALIVAATLTFQDRVKANTAIKQTQKLIVFKDQRIQIQKNIILLQKERIKALSALIDISEK